MSMDQLQKRKARTVAAARAWSQTGRQGLHPSAGKILARARPVCQPEPGTAGLQSEVCAMAIIPKRGA